MLDDATLTEDLKGLRHNFAALIGQLPPSLLDQSRETLCDVGTGITSYLAAHTILEFLGRICDQPRWIARRDEREALRRAATG